MKESNLQICYSETPCTRLFSRISLLLLSQNHLFSVNIEGEAISFPGPGMERKSPDSQMPRGSPQRSIYFKPSGEKTPMSTALGDLTLMAMVLEWQNF